MYRLRLAHEYSFPGHPQPIKADYDDGRASAWGLSVCCLAADLRWRTSRAGVDMVSRSVAGSAVKSELVICDPPHDVEICSERLQ